MSQQMHFDEEPRGYQGVYTPMLEENSGSYNQRIEEVQAQKVGGAYNSSKSPSPWQRMVVALVSLFVLLVGMGFLTTGDTTNLFVVGIRLAGLITISIVAAAINYSFNVGSTTEKSK